MLVGRPEEFDNNRNPSGTAADFVCDRLRPGSLDQSLKVTLSILGDPV
ncbi:MAG: hypothetical protein KL863_05285 [Rhizobium sp.]|nr:hypothetical protein [Rhizobium sp.]